MILKPLRLIPAALLVSATPAFAAEGGGPLDVNLGLMIWTLIIFTIVLLVLRRFAWPNILGAVEAREARIRELLSAAEADRAAAQTALEESRRQLDQTRHQVQETLSESRVSAERMREEILAGARRDQEELMNRARRDIAAERETALQQVRLEAVDLAIAAAEKLIRRNLSGEDNRRLVREYLGQVDAQPGSPAAAGA